ncbi:hypothetical protein E0L35_05905 [Halomonas sp. ATBC28]|uniref:hypothetical protein n=1 Tax=Halomonadaceae TaxID=28256 RepID=UPI000481ACBE|nr:MULTISPECIES: hypothetical protein [unclassified Halomonas]PKH61623.1 hypothetical protein CXF94_10590 [Halomonas sp. Choline-3u-9]QGQ71326.1 hypothetical protein FDY98_16605 [Halomonas sp. PA16-9]TMU26390.1 hypothetical protein E0L35_05905 [Halomonas sp. ATBC28]
MEEKTQKAFDFAADLVKQLITLSTAIIALTVTFAKDIFAENGDCFSGWLVAAWITYFLSIIFGVWALMALTGTLDPPKNKSPSLSIQGGNCRLPTGLQILAFLMGIGLTITYAIKSL